MLLRAALEQDRPAEAMAIMRELDVHLAAGHPPPAQWGGPAPVEQVRDAPPSWSWA